MMTSAARTLVDGGAVGSTIILPSVATQETGRDQGRKSKVRSRNDTEIVDTSGHSLEGSRNIERGYRPLA